VALATLALAKRAASGQVNINYMTCLYRSSFFNLTDDRLIDSPQAAMMRSVITAITP